MSEENRDSSGSSTAMIVVAILGGVLLLGCCGGVVVLAGGMFYARSHAVEEMEVMEAQQFRIQQELQSKMEENADKMREDVEALTVPGGLPPIAPPEGAPVPAPPVSSEKEE